MPDQLFLGLDVGTTKVAAVVADKHGRVRAAVSSEHKAGVPAPAGRAEQDAKVLLGATWAAVRALPAAVRQQVSGVGVTGQMHGVVLLDAALNPASPLITWQDGRCLEEPGFLEALCSKAGSVVHAGYGLATLAWMQRHAKLPPEAVAASTVHDLVVARLCALPRPLTDPSSAASWGFFDLETSAWDQAALAASGISAALVPKVRPFGSVAGRLDPAWAAQLGLPEGLLVCVALGDLQASLVATIQAPDTEVALTLGTGGQAAVVVEASGAEGPVLRGASYAVWPYPGGRRVLVAASLSGGSAWAWLIDSLEAWLRDLGMTPPPPAVLFEKINALGLAAPHQLAVRSHFLGERHSPALRGSIAGLTPDNFTLGGLARGLARSIVQTLHDMLPPEALQNRVRLVGSGNALRRTPLLQHMAEAVFGLPLALAEDREEAATGAALIAAGTI